MTDRSETPEVSRPAVADQAERRRFDVEEIRRRYAHLSSQVARDACRGADEVRQLRQELSEAQAEKARLYDDIDAGNRHRERLREENAHLKRPLPVVSGRWVLTSLEELERAFKVCLRNEQERPMADTALIRVLCEAVRLCRESEPMVRENATLRRALTTARDELRRTAYGTTGDCPDCQREDCRSIEALHTDCPRGDALLVVLDALGEEPRSHA